jgi:lambda repressor-like predicted transcriptional regulator
MGVVVQPARLRIELARRGWSAADLARQSGVSAATITAALAGRGIAAKSLGLIAAALSRVPPNSTIDVMKERSVASA